jgi:glucose-fructose oxidoreductase
VDEHSVTVCRYETGLSKYETRWGTFTDPWTSQPTTEMRVRGRRTEGTISSYDYESVIPFANEIAPETHEVPVDVLPVSAPRPVEYLIHCLETDETRHWPTLADMARIGSEIVDSAVLSAQRKRTVPLLEGGDL